MQYIRVILPRGKGSGFMKLLKDNGAFGVSCFYGEGSAPSEILNKFQNLQKIKDELDKNKKAFEDGKNYKKSIDNNLKEKEKEENHIILFKR